MKLDPSIPFLLSLLALVLCPTAAIGALMFGKFDALIHSWEFSAILVASVATLVLSYRALGKPLAPGEERVALLPERQR